MKKIHAVTAIALAIGGAFSAAQATTVDFSGYFRAGTGRSTVGGTQTCYQLAGADTKWRLGNECDYVIEPNLVATLAKNTDGSEWRVHFMPSVYRAWGGSEFGATGPGVTSSGTDELVARFGQVFGYGQNIPQLAGGTVWAGRRFYNRVQLGINDQFLENNDGDGAGIENMNLGFSKFSWAFMMNPRYNDVNLNRYIVPLRFANIKTFKDSELDVHVGWQHSTVSTDQSTAAFARPVGQPDGQSVGLYHSTSGILGGSTFVGLRYDNNDTSKGSVNQRNRRVVVQQTGFLAGAQTSWDVIGEVRRNTSSNSEGNRWYSVGGRTDTHISGPFRFLVELGHDRVKPDSSPTRSMTKLTLAGAVSAGPDAGSRPTIRLFYTYARWNEAARAQLSGSTKEVYGNGTYGSSVGAQVEAWW